MYCLFGGSLAKRKSLNSHQFINWRLRLLSSEVTARMTRVTWFFFTLIDLFTRESVWSHSKWMALLKGVEAANSSVIHLIWKLRTGFIALHSGRSSVSVQSFVGRERGHGVSRKKKNIAAFRNESFYKIINGWNINLNQYNWIKLMLEVDGPFRCYQLIRAKFIF